MEYIFSEIKDINEDIENSFKNSRNIFGKMKYKKRKKELIEMITNLFSKNSLSLELLNEYSNILIGNNSDQKGKYLHCTKVSPSVVDRLHSIIFEFDIPYSDCKGVTVFLPTKEGTYDINYNYLKSNGQILISFTEKDIKMIHDMRRYGKTDFDGSYIEAEIIKDATTKYILEDMYTFAMEIIKEI